MYTCSMYNKIYERRNKKNISTAPRQRVPSWSWPFVSDYGAECPRRSSSRWRRAALLVSWPESVHETIKEYYQYSRVLKVKTIFRLFVFCYLFVCSLQTETTSFDLLDYLVDSACNRLHCHRYSWSCIVRTLCVYIYI